MRFTRFLLKSVYAVPTVRLTRPRVGLPSRLRVLFAARSVLGMGSQNGPGRHEKAARTAVGLLKVGREGDPRREACPRGRRGGGFTTRTDFPNPYHIAVVHIDETAAIRPRPSLAFRLGFGERHSNPLRVEAVYTALLAT